MTKRLFRIGAGINGGELVISTVTKEFVEYMQRLEEDEGESEMIEALENAENDPEYYEGPEIYEDFSGCREVDDLEHLYGVCADTEWSWVELPAGVREGPQDSIEDEGKVFEPMHLHGREAYHEDNDDAKEKYDVVPCLVYHLVENGHKGCWFVETDGEDFDPNKFCYSTVVTHVAEIVDQTWYDKEEIHCDQTWSDTQELGARVQVGYFNKDWHDTKEKRLAKEEFWEIYDESLRRTTE